MARWVFSQGGALGFCDSEGHVEPAVSVRLRWKNHEIQTEIQSQGNEPLNICFVFEDEMDEEDMDEKEEQSEESRAVRVGQKKMMTPTLAEREEHERTHFLSKLVQTLYSRTGTQPSSSRPKVCNCC